MTKVILEALDQVAITPRTGKFKVQGVCETLPTENSRLMVFYDANENTESPGVVMYPEGIERLGNEFKFFDTAKRPFKLTIVS